jgi:two-component system, response regulator PdtaR
LAASALAERSGLESERPIVLIVEDEVLLRLMIADELRSNGLSVVEAANADEALTVLRSSAPVDLLFTDIRMPGSMDGLALAALMRATQPELKIIVTSGQSPRSLSRDIAEAFFDKPYDARAVVKRITELLVTSLDFHGTRVP